MLSPRVTNNTGIPLALAVWLLHDEYDYHNKENYFSLTTLLKPLRQIVLPRRKINKLVAPPDVADFVARALGHSLHDSIEKAWKVGYKRSLALLGTPEDVIEAVRINPTDEERRADPGMLPVFLEQRAYREVTVNGVTYTIGGKFDMVMEGLLNDNKSTSVYAYIFGGRDNDYILQMSGYDWIDKAQPMPRITEDHGVINFIFTDWQKSQARSNANYPSSRVGEKRLPLLGEAEMDLWVKRKLTLIQKYMDAPETQLPECSDEELWRSEPKFKYYSDPVKAKTPGARSTKNFTTLAEANQHLSSAGKGTVVTEPGEPKRCGYCDAFDRCTQKDRYFPT